MRGCFIIVKAIKCRLAIQDSNMPNENTCTMLAGIKFEYSLLYNMQRNSISLYFGYVDPLDNIRTTVYDNAIKQ